MNKVNVQLVDILLFSQVSDKFINDFDEESWGGG